MLPFNCYPVNDPPPPPSSLPPSAGHNLLVLYPVCCHCQVRCFSFYSRKCACVDIYPLQLYLHLFICHAQRLNDAFMQTPVQRQLARHSPGSGADRRTGPEHGTAPLQHRFSRGPQQTQPTPKDSCMRYIHERPRHGRCKRACHFQRSLARAEWWVTYTLPLSSKEAQHREGVT